MFDRTLFPTVVGSTEKREGMEGVVDSLVPGIFSAVVIGDGFSELRGDIRKARNGDCCKTDEK